MDIGVARIVCVSIIAGGALVWLAALRFLLASRRHGPQSGFDDDTGEQQAEGWLEGAAEVDGEAGDLADRAARMLAQGKVTHLGLVKVLDKADDRIRFERAGMPNAPGQWFRRGELRFIPVRSGQTRVSWLVEPTASAWLLWFGGVFQVVGLIALVAGGWAVYTYLASSPEPALRWQTLQMLQAVHFLWPPFLFGALYRAGTRSLKAQFEALANNLPYCEE